MGETLRRTLEYLGIAEEEEVLPAEPEHRLEHLERRVEEQAAEIESLREELERLRGGG